MNDACSPKLVASLSRSGRASCVTCLRSHKPFNTHPTRDRQLLARSVFCLVAAGDGWSARFDDAMLHGWWGF